MQDRVRVSVLHQVRGPGLGQVCRRHQLQEAACGDLWPRLRVPGGARGVSRQAGGHPGGRPRGDLRPQPPEDLQTGDQAGAQPQTQAGVHHRAPGDLHPQVHSAQAGAQASADQVVPGPHPRRAWRVLRRGERRRPRHRGCLRGQAPGHQRAAQLPARRAAGHRVPQPRRSPPGQDQELPGSAPSTCSVHPAAVPVRSLQEPAEELWHPLLSNSPPDLRESSPDCLLIQECMN